MEKRKPTFDLDTIKSTFSSVDTLRMTRTASNCALALGLTERDIVQIIQGMTRSYFVKSMTSLNDHRTWQDVYNVPHEDIVLYVKFTVDLVGHLLISFKEKG